MRYHSTDKIRLSMPKAALQAIFSECDGFDQDETGGRVIGTFEEERGMLLIRVSGIIEAGPQARRSAVSFFQDGEHQERIFRRIEAHHREIEHLGNWHTHHVNGLQHLSGGDIDTYSRTVNHHRHNAPFFYALLVTSKHEGADALNRYSVKHFVFRRGDERIYELQRKQVEIIDAPLVWPQNLENSLSRDNVNRDLHSLTANSSRAYDNEILAEFYKGVRPYSNAKLGMYWRGPLELLDGSRVEVVLLEDSSESDLTYTVTLREPPSALKCLADEIAGVEFRSARAALMITERKCNRVLYDGKVK